MGGRSTGEGPRDWGQDRCRKEENEGTRTRTSAEGDVVRGTTKRELDGCGDFYEKSICLEKFVGTAHPVDKGRV